MNHHLAQPRVERPVPEDPRPERPHPPGQIRVDAERAKQRQRLDLGTRGHPLLKHLSHTWFVRRLERRDAGTFRLVSHEIHSALETEAASHATVALLKPKRNPTHA
jgi:hypothetical protein